MKMDCNTYNTTLLHADCELTAHYSFEISGLIVLIASIVAIYQWLKADIGPVTYEIRTTQPRLWRLAAFLVCAPGVYFCTMLFRYMHNWINELKKETPPETDKAFGLVQYVFIFIVAFSTTLLIVFLAWLWLFFVVLLTKVGKVKPPSDEEAGIPMMRSDSRDEEEEKREDGKDGDNDTKDSTDVPPSSSDSQDTKSPTPGPKPTTAKENDANLGAEPIGFQERDTARLETSRASNPADNDLTPSPGKAVRFAEAVKNIEEDKARYWSSCVYKEDDGNGSETASERYFSIS